MFDPWAEEKRNRKTFALIDGQIIEYDIAAPKKWVKENITRKVKYLGKGSIHHIEKNGAVINSVPRDSGIDFFKTID